MNKRTLIPFTLSIIVLFAAAGAYVITFRAMSSLQEESFRLSEEIKAAKDREERLSRAQRTLQLINEQEEQVFSYFVTEETIVSFLENLEGIEEETNVEIDIVSVSSNEKEGKFVMNLTVEGRFQNVMRTLGAIETLPKFIEIEKGGISTVVRDEDLDSGIWTASATYSVRQK